MRFKKQVTTVNSVKTFYWEKNQTKKEVIIFLHGFPGNHSGLVDMANGFKNKYRLIIPDLPACGISEPLKEEHVLKNLAQWLNNFLNNLSIDKAIIVGHSFGSRLALVFCVDYPEKVQKLVLLTPVAKVDGFIDRIASLEYKTAKILPEKLRKVWLSNRVYQGAVHMVVFKTASAKRRKMLIERDIKEFSHFTPRVNIEIFDEFYNFSLIPTGQKVKIKSLIVAGDKDEVATMFSVRELVVAMNAELKVMKNSGHLVPLERPLATAKIIQKWLEDNAIK